MVKKMLQWRADEKKGNEVVSHHNHDAVEVERRMENGERIHEQ